MDELNYADLRIRIDCGEFDCLKNCCQAGGPVALLVLRDTLKDMSDRDVTLFARMLCASCAPATSPKVPSVPTTSNCVNSAVQWARDNRLFFNAAQLALELAEDFGANSDMRILAVVKALNIALEFLEDLAISPEGTPADEIVDAVCSMAVNLEEGIRWFESLAPEFAKPATDAFKKLRSITTVAAHCCVDFPKIDTSIPGGGGGGVPISDTVPVTSTTPYPYPYQPVASILPTPPSKVS